MAYKRYLAFVSTASLLHLRSIKHRLLKVAPRFSNSLIITFSTSLNDIEQRSFKRRIIDEEFDLRTFIKTLHHV